jgi:hypothetical protein
MSNEQMRVRGVWREERAKIGWNFKPSQREKN